MSRTDLIGSAPRTKLVALASVGLLGLAACGGTGGTGGSGDTASSAATGDSAAAATGTVTVFAAASLQESFTQIGTQFEEANPGVKVEFSFGPSSGLAQQINSGAPADVFASASAKNMEQVVETQAAENPTTFAKNVLQIAVPPANPGKVEGVNDLAKAGVKVALCQEQVPCGTVSKQVFEKAGINVTPVTRENDVKAVLTKVQLGEVDAGLVYATDVKASGDKVKGVEIPGDVNASTSYPIAVLAKAPNKAGAQAFVDYVLSTDGAKVITEAGFAAP